MWIHFETFHVLFRGPTYVSKYYPAQGGLFLAVGPSGPWTIPFWGVWLSALFLICAPLYLLDAPLQVWWLPPEWALLGGLSSAVIRFGRIQLTGPIATQAGAVAARAPRWCWEPWARIKQGTASLAMRC